MPPRPLILSSKDKFLISLLCFRQETLFLVSLAAVLWMGERCVTSKKRLLGRLPYFPTLIYFVSHKKLSVSKSNVMGLEFLKKYIVGFSHLDRASSIFTLFLKIPVRKDTLLKTQNSESVSLKTIPCSVAHNSLSQLRESPPSIQRGWLPL